MGVCIILVRLDILLWICRDCCVFVGCVVVLRLCVCLR